MKIYKGYKVRVYPTKDQIELIWKHIHACRFIWNYMLEWQENNFASGGKFLHEFGMNYMLTPLKKQEEYAWLREVSNTSLKRVCREVDKAYVRFFEKMGGHPRFKSKKNAKLTYPICCENFLVENGYMRVQKVGMIKYKSDYVFPEGKGHKFVDVRFYIEGKKYYITFCLECESQAHELTENSMGIDLGVKELAVVSCGDEHIVYHNINKSKQIRDLNKRIKRLQYITSRKYNENHKRTGNWDKSNNIIRIEDKIRRLHKRIVGIRMNYMHHITHELVSKLPARVVMEKLNVLGMMKNRHLSSAVQEQGFYIFIKTMKYKCEYNGIEFIQAPRFFPSSKTCSCCGYYKKDLKLSDRTFVCPKCGLVIDRDYNAAINLSKYTD